MGWGWLFRGDVTTSVELCSTTPARPQRLPTEKTMRAFVCLWIKGEDVLAVPKPPCRTPSLSTWTWTLRKGRACVQGALAKGFQLGRRRWLGWLFEGLGPVDKRVPGRRACDLVLVFARACVAAGVPWEGSVCVPGGVFTGARSGLIFGSGGGLIRRQCEAASVERRGSRFHVAFRRMLQGSERLPG